MWCRCLERILRSGSSRRWLQNGWLRWSTLARCECAEGVPHSNHTVEYDPFIKSRNASRNDLRVLCGANLVTYHANFRGGETRTALRVGRGLLCQAACTVDGCWRSYLTESVFKVVLQKSAPISVRQLILHIGNHKGKVDEFVQMCKHFL